MSLKTSWPVRCALALLTAQLASACGGGGGGPTDPPPASDTAAPTTRATPAGGSFANTVAVALVCEDGTGSGCDATYYTLDGSAPTSASTRYREPFTLATTTTVRFFSVDKKGNAEGAKSEQYTFTSAEDTVAPTTVADPAGGALNSPRSVALRCSDGTGSGCAATYYTVDGSLPTDTSARYTAPLAVSASTTLRFFSVDVAGNAEGVKTERYVLDTAVPVVSASPRGGTFGAAVNVALACDDGAGSGCAAIHYTTDGSIPSAASPVYSAPLPLQATTRLRFLAVDRAGNASDVVSEQYTLDGTGPVSAANPRGGTFRAAFTVSLTCDDGTGSGCAATYYTVNGGTPTRDSQRFLSPIVISGNTTLRFFSVDSANNAGPVVTETYVLDGAAPVTQASPAGRSYAGEQLVTLTCEDPAGSGCAATYYTLDGTAPTTSSPLYVMPVRVSTSLTLRFFSVDMAGNVESVRTEPYVIDTAAPVVSASPAGGTYATAQRVTLTCNDGSGSGCAGIHYTLDGTTPTLDSAVYSAALQLGANTTLRFFAVDAVGNRSAVQTQTYSIDTAAPLTTASPSGGTFGGDTQVTLACDDGTGTGCAVTRYTVDGTVPNGASPRYTVPVTVASSGSLRFFSVDNAGNSEPVRVVAFTIDRLAPVTSVSVGGGNFGGAQTVTLSCQDTGGSTCAATYFTTDGSAPSTSSPRYSQALRFESTTTLRFFSVDAVGNSEAAKQETYVIDITPPTTTATPAGGTYRVAQDVTLTCDDGSGVGCSGTIRYTTDPAAPVASFLTYSAPIRVAANATLRFFSSDGVGNTEAVKSQAYVIDTAAPTVAASPRGGRFFEPRAVTLTCSDVGTGCAGIFFTRNGGTPTTSSERYQTPLDLSTNTTLRFIGVDGAGNTSAVGEETYTFSSDTTAPVTVADPDGGVFTSSRSVSLVCTDEAGGSGCAATYYTLDGSPPTTSSPRYTQPFTISSTTEVRFFSVDAAGNTEVAKRRPFTIDSTPPVTAATPPGGTYPDTMLTVTLQCTDTGTGCAVTRYTVDGSVPDGSSPVYGGALTLTRSTVLRFYSMDAAGNVEPMHEEVYTLPNANSQASEQIAAVRAAVDGSSGLPIDGAVITYVKPAVGNLTNDPAGFFLQAERTGPALFVTADPSVLFPMPAAGMRVNVTVNNKRLASGMVRADLGSYAEVASGVPLAQFVQEVSNVDVPAAVRDYEAELIGLTGTLNGAFTTAGSGHSQAPLVTAGVPAESPSAILYRLRVVDTVREQLDLTAGCTVSIVSPLWFFQTNSVGNISTQASVWAPEQVLSQTCPGPRVASAQALDSRTVIVRFDRNLNASSVLTNGSQFSIPGLTVSRATVVTNREVWVSTNTQVPRQPYTVTVASTVRDTAGTGVEPTGNAGNFPGWTQPAVLRITEIAPSVANGRDLVELFVLQGGSVNGMTLVDASSGTPLATLPDVNVATREMIVIHLTPDRVTPGTDAPGSELTSRTQYPQGMYASNFDTAWDFQGGNTGISSGNRVFRIRDSLGNTQDAFAAATPGNTTAAYLTQLQALQAEGQWLPSDCGGALCTYDTTFPTAYDVSVNWNSVFPSGGRTTTVGRVIAGDGNRADEWVVGQATLGLLNP